MDNEPTLDPNDELTKFIELQSLLEQTILQIQRAKGSRRSELGRRLAILRTEAEKVDAYLKAYILQPLAILLDEESERAEKP